MVDQLYVQVVEQWFVVDLYFWQWCFVFCQVVLQVVVKDLEEIVWIVYFQVVVVVGVVLEVVVQVFVCVDGVVFWWVFVVEQVEYLEYCVGFVGVGEGQVQCIFVVVVVCMYVQFVG